MPRMRFFAARGKEYSMDLQHVFPCLVPMSFREKLPGDTVFRRFFDLAVVYREEPPDGPAGSDTESPPVRSRENPPDVPASAAADGLPGGSPGDPPEPEGSRAGSLFVTAEDLAEEGCTEQDVYETALGNAVRKRPAVIRDIRSIIPCAQESSPPMYVLSNRELCYGASAILYPGIRKVLGSVFEEDLILIPSSVHEWIILPRDTGADTAFMNELIGHVNRTEVRPDEVLGSHVYFYRLQDHMLTM